MTLAFTNLSRSFDSSREAVRFTGHDGIFEVSFIVETSALAKAGEASDKTVLSEAESLSAFDAKRPAIHDVAREAYAKGKRNFYVLSANDFR